MPDAFEKFCPRKWDVPAWIALRSCTIASMLKVCTAPGKRSLSVFSPVNNRDGQIVARESLVNTEHFHGFLTRLGFRLVRGMALLPEEFRRAQEQSRPQLPADHVGPLIDEGLEDRATT